jgi:hypothetical protein
MVVRGLSSDGVATASDLLCLLTRRSPITNDAIQHLDNVSQWRGISPAQAVELKVWLGVFRESLESLIKKRVQQALDDEICGHSGESRRSFELLCTSIAGLTLTSLQIPRMSLYSFLA